MITGVEVLSPATERAVGADEFRRLFVQGIETAIEDTLGGFAGEVVVDPDGTWLTIDDDGAAINERKLTVDGLATVFLNSGKAIKAGAGQDAITRADGARTVTLLSPVWFEDLPYRNQNGSAYRVYVGTCQVPTDVGVTRTNIPVYASYADVPGFVVVPDTLDTTGNRLTFGLSTCLTSLGMQPWLTANTMNDSWSYRAVVWLDSSISGVRVMSPDPSVAVLAVRLVKASSGGFWTVQTPVNSVLGQTPGSLDANASHYRIAILGPLITTTDLDTDPDWAHIGVVTSSTGSEAFNHDGQIRSLSFGQLVAGISKFTEEHSDIDGTHTDVNALTVTTSGGTTGGDRQHHYRLGASGAGVKRQWMVPLDQLPPIDLTNGSGLVMAYWQWVWPGGYYQLKFRVAKGADDTPAIGVSPGIWRWKVPIPVDAEGSGGSVPAARWYCRSLAVTACGTGTPATRDTLKVRLVRYIYNTTDLDYGVSRTERLLVDGPTPGADWDDGGTMSRGVDYEADDAADYGSAGAVVEGSMSTYSALGPTDWQLEIEFDEGDAYSFDAASTNIVTARVRVAEITIEVRQMTAEW